MCKLKTLREDAKEKLSQEKTHGGINVLVRGEVH